MRGLELIRPEWPAPPSVRAAATTRRGGVSRPPYAELNLGLRAGDDPAAVAENRARLKCALGLPAAPYWLEQRHGARVLTLEEAAPGDRAADGAATARPGRVCAVLTADCLPVLLCADAGDWVAAAHVGWRGLAADILAVAVAAYPGDPARLMAWRGPAIGAENYEVGADVRAALGDELAAAAWRPLGNGRGRLDLAAGAAWQLARLGVARCYGGGDCAFRDAARFYSHRRDGATGRQAALIWLEPAA